MKRSLACALMLGTISAAHADVTANLADAPDNPLATPWSRPQATYRFVDPGLGGLNGDGVSAATVSHVIYLNNCKTDSCTMHPGNDDSTTNSSSIPSQTSTVT